MAPIASFLYRLPAYNIGLCCTDGKEAIRHAWALCVAGRVCRLHMGTYTRRSPGHDNASKRRPTAWAYLGREQSRRWGLFITWRAISD